MKDSAARVLDQEEEGAHVEASGNRVHCRPFLKWVGGKGQLLPELLPRVPWKFKTYYEPFLGGGALLFGMQPKRAVAFEINEELVDAYRAVKEDVEPLIQELRKHVYSSSYFYGMRDADRDAAYLNWSRVERASRLIYLNKTCFNGLYRVNARGFFNVPFGKYTNPRILDADNLRACSEVLSNVKVCAKDFREVEGSAVAGDFVYFDPPYVPLNATSHFTAYSSGGFDLQMQRELAALCRRLDKKGVQFMLSNSSSPTVKELYGRFRLEHVSAMRAINSKGDRRGKIAEVVVRNY